MEIILYMSQNIHWVWPVALEDSSTDVSYTESPKNNNFVLSMESSHFGQRRR